MATIESCAYEVLERRRAGSYEPWSGEGWIIEVASRGHNGVVWRGRRPGDADFAIKVGIVDERRRGEHELAAATRLESLGLDLGPRAHLLLEEADLFAFAATWCSGQPFSELLEWTSPHWSAIVRRYAELHRASGEGLPAATPGPLIERQLELAAAFALQAGWGSVEELIAAVRQCVSDVSPGRSGFVHWDTNPSNVLIDGELIRFVDWEYSGMGDPSGDIANLCTSPSVVDMPDDLASRLVAEHAEALRDDSQVERTNAWMLSMLTYWCCRVGNSRKRGIAERGIDPRRDAVARIDEYRDRLAERLGWRRAKLDQLLAP